MKSRLDYAEIYITNVCNYSCSHCQSLNNFAFKGHQKWHDYKEEYDKLSKKIDIDIIQIIGGEPALNPDLEKWLEGISNLWPQTKLQISTNGSRLDKISPKIYEILARHNGTLWITCHDINLYNNFFQFTKEWLSEIVHEYPAEAFETNWEYTYNLFKEDNWPDCSRIEDYDKLPQNIKKQFVEKIRSDTEHPKTSSIIYIDKNGVEIRLDWSQSFVSSVIDIIDKDRLVLKNNSNPQEAHNNCYFKSCHQINKGKVYKCPLVSVLPDFLKQFDVVMSDEDRNLALNYQPMTSNYSDIQAKKFVEDIDKPIPQCKFCPSKYAKHNFVGTDKKNTSL